jgi:hypothetical protein
MACMHVLIPTMADWIDSNDDTGLTRRCQHCCIAPGTGTITRQDLVGPVVLVPTARQLQASSAAASTRHQAITRPGAACHGQRPQRPAHVALNAMMLQALVLTATMNTSNSTVSATVWHTRVQGQSDGPRHEALHKLHVQERLPGTRCLHLLHFSKAGRCNPGANRRPGLAHAACVQSTHRRHQAAHTASSAAPHAQHAATWQRCLSHLSTSWASARSAPQATCMPGVRPARATGALIQHRWMLSRQPCCRPRI